MTRNPLEPQGSPGERSSPEPACMGHLVSRFRSAKQLSSREATMAYLFSKTRMSPFLVQCQRGCEQPRLWEWWCLPCRSHNSHVRSRAQASPEQYLKNWVPLKAREALRTIGEQAGLFPACSGFARQCWCWLPSVLKPESSFSGTDNMGFTGVNILGMLDSTFKTKQNLI